MSTPFERDPRLAADAGFKGLITSALRRIRGGELGSLPVVIGLVVIWSIFQTQNENFLTPGNLTNLLLQVAAVGTISVGIFFVLLLGDVDLSAGSVSGVTAALLAVLTVNHGWNPVLGILAAAAFGALIGFFHGTIYAKLGVPPFVVTLAGLIGWQGLQLKILGTTGTINLPSSFITDLTTTFFSDVTGWVLTVVAIAAFGASQFLQRHRRASLGLELENAFAPVVRVLAVAAGLIATVAVMNDARGVPLAVLIFIGFIVFFEIVTQHTTYGRHIYAVGGNAEAARRAGINVRFIKITVFMLASTMAAIGGVLAASRLIAVNQSSGGNDILLNAIAAAVIGGTSLFGGRGRAYSVLLGMLVIGSISNGLDLLSQSQATKFMITGGVLLAAVTLDSFARRSRTATGR
jgi:D-xylose transport system permease protein